MRVTNLETFIEQANIIHNNYYDYSESEYENCSTPLIVKCPIHGPFPIRPNNHLSIYKSSWGGCQKCSNHHRPTTDEFIDKSKQKFGNKYTYEKTRYGKNNVDPIIITCSIHGDFNVTPAYHMRSSGGGGCNGCAKLVFGAYHKKTTEQFIVEAKNIHGNEYNYDLVEYVNTHTKVKIGCSVHGIFEVTPASHVKQGTKCRLCSFKDHQGGFNYKRFTNHPEIKDIPAVLYVIQILGEESFIKIGITQKELAERFNKGRFPYEYSIITTFPGKTYDLFVIEQAIKKQFKSVKYKPLNKFDGHSECFMESHLDVIVNAIENPNKFVI